MEYDSDDGDYVDYVSDEPVYVEFDGSSRGNPGQAGAGAMIRTIDGSVILGVCKGLGYATNNEAEYEGLKLALATALELGYRRAHVRGDSLLVTNQVKGIWKINNWRLRERCREVHELMDQYQSVDIEHFSRENNFLADAEANKGARLPEGVVRKSSPR